MSNAQTAPKGRRRYATADPERFRAAFGLAEAHRFVAENGAATPRIAVVDSVIPDVAGDDDGPEELDVVARKVFGEPTDDRTSTHGTKSAAVAAAAWSNAVGVRGVSSAEILAAGLAFGGGFDGNPVAAAVEWAVENDADVITMSLSVADTPRFREAVAAAREAGVVVVTSAGNSDAPLSEKPRSAPAVYDGVVSVGATDSYGQRASFPRDPPRYELNAGDDPRIVWGSTWPADVSAWGVHVPTIRSDDADGREDTDYWWQKDFHNGTSAACPVVAGVVSLMLRVNPDLTGREVRVLLRETGTELDTDHPIGPRVHAARAVKAAFDRR
jgi:hypothetical protein